MIVDAQWAHPALTSLSRSCFRRVGHASAFNSPAEILGMIQQAPGSATLRATVQAKITCWASLGYVLRPAWQGRETGQ